jgi:hypothetical protein
MVTVSVLLFAVYVYTIVDAALRDRARVRLLPKPVWLLVVVLLPLLGSLLWFALGRGRGPAPEPNLPREDPAEADRAQRIRRLEQELERRRGSGESAQR